MNKKRGCLRRRYHLWRTDSDRFKTPKPRRPKWPLTRKFPAELVDNDMSQVIHRKLSQVREFEHNFLIHSDNFANESKSWAASRLVHNLFNNTFIYSLLATKQFYNFHCSKIDDKWIFGSALLLEKNSKTIIRTNPIETRGLHQFYELKLYFWTKLIESD